MKSLAYTASVAIMTLAAALIILSLGSCTNPVEPVVIDCAANRQAAIDLAIANSPGKQAVGIGYYCPQTGGADGIKWEYVEVRTQQGAVPARADLPSRGIEFCWDQWACWYWKDVYGFWHLDCATREVCVVYGEPE